MPERLQLDAAIVAVTVYPDQARITRRGRIPVPAGGSEVALDGLPLALLTDSVRVSGRGGDRARITGVDVNRRFHERSPDPRVEALENQVEDLHRQLQALDDDDAAEGATVTFLEALARRAGSSFARALAAGTATAGATRDFTVELTEQLRATQERRRDLATRRNDLERALEAANRELESIRRQAATERYEVTVSVESDEPTDLELEISAVVLDAGWHPVYDCRLDEHDHVQLAWHGVVTQRTGEDWPECEVSLSTARPAVSATIPELDPWYVDVYRPPQPIARAAPLAAGTPASGSGGADIAEPQMVRFEAAKLAADLAEPLTQATAAADAGRLAMTYRLPRPLAVPSDGSPHKATIAEATLEADLDYFAVPKIAPEAYLRATITNSSGLTLLPGPASVFHGHDFVGTTAIESVAPGATFDLQLGIDDRVKVERDLVKRSTSKTLIGGNRRTSVTYRITVENHRDQPVKVAVSDQFPVSRHEAVKVRDTEAKPAPADRTDLDVITWKFDLAPAAKQELTLSFELEHPRDLQLTGWTD